MANTIKTTLHTFLFDTNAKEGKDAWEQFKSERKEWPHCHGPVLADTYHAFRELDGKEIELEIAHLFDNQWNTAPIAGITEKGLRVFDYALQSDSAPHAGPQMSAPRGIRRGHWLEQTAEMKEVRRNTMKCGYCGKQEPAAKGYVFCPHCIDSEYLKESDLKLTRMRSVDESGVGGKFPELSEAEKAYLLPLYKEAQLHGSTERGKARIAKERLSIAKEYESTVKHATTKRDGLTWLMDHGIKLDNVIYYSHTNTFSFGWRNPVSDDIKSALLDIISEFPFAYEIKCADGRTLSGNVG